MISKSTDASLRAGFEANMDESENHIARLDRVFALHGVAAGGVNCPAIDGILEEADELAGDIADKGGLDAALIAAAQAVEHYEITRYGTLVAWAKKLGRNDCAALLQATLDEEKAADHKLSVLALQGINQKAAWGPVDYGGAVCTPPLRLTWRGTDLTGINAVLGLDWL